MKTPNPLLKIGDVVNVSGKIEIYYENYQRTMARVAFDQPKRAIVSGATRRQLGTVRPARGLTSLYADDYNPGSLVIEKVVFVYQVRFGLMRKQFECLPEDVCPVQ